MSLLVTPDDVVAYSDVYVSADRERVRFLCEMASAVISRYARCVFPEPPPLDVTLVGARVVDRWLRNPSDASSVNIAVQSGSWAGDPSPRILTGDERGLIDAAAAAFRVDTAPVGQITVTVGLP